MSEMGYRLQKYTFMSPISVIALRGQNEHFLAKEKHCFLNAIGQRPDKDHLKTIGLKCILNH